jgi:hypothetical protein
MSEDAQALFAKAQDDFLAGLSDSERATFSRCNSSADLLASCQNFDVIAKVKRRGLPLLRRIKCLSDNLEPYFKVMEILCSTHPEWANIVLGTFRLVLTVLILLLCYSS